VGEVELVAFLVASAQEISKKSVSKDRKEIAASGSRCKCQTGLNGNSWSKDASFKLKPAYKR